MNYCLLLLSILLVFAVIAYWHKKIEFNELQEMYNKQRYLLNNKCNEIKNIKKNYEYLNNNYDKLRNEYKEELNKRQASENRLEKAIEVFKKQKQDISNL